MMDFHTVKQKAKDAAMYLKDPWTLSWVVSGLVTILVPVIMWNAQSQAYYRQYGVAIEYEQKQRQYEEYYKQQQEANNGNNNNNNNYYTYKECSFFNIACKKKQYYYATAEERQKAYENGEAVQTYPDWFILFGGYEQSEEMQRWKEENTGVRAEDMINDGRSSGMKFVYTMTLFLFIALLVFGAISIGNRKNMSQLVIFLVIATVMAFSNLLMAMQGLISSDERMFEESIYGWSGQMGVLMVYTNFWVMLFCIGHIIAIRVKQYMSWKDGEKEDLAEEGSDYNQYTAPDESQVA